MTKVDIQQMQAVLKVMLAFINAFAGILAAYPGPELPPLMHLMAAATVAGCGAGLLMLQPPGGPSETKRVADEIERRLKRQAAGKG